MHGEEVWRLPVVDDARRISGLISLGDVARELHRERAFGARWEVGAEDLSETLAAICESRRGSAATPRSH